MAVRRWSLLKVSSKGKNFFNFIKRTWKKRLEILLVSNFMQKTNVCFSHFVITWKFFDWHLKESFGIFVIKLLLAIPGWLWCLPAYFPAFFEIFKWFSSFSRSDPPNPEFPRLPSSYPPPFTPHPSPNPFQLLGTSFSTHIRFKDT